MRCFIGIQLGQVSREKLDKVKQVLRDCSLEVKWVEKYNLHITLKFLGAITQRDIKEVTDVLADVIAKQDSFRLNIEGLGAFPNLDYPKTIWAGVNKGQQKLEKLHQTIEQELITLGFKQDEHDYTPHITLGRVNRAEKNLDIMSQKLKEFPFQIKIEEVIEQISLIKSTLTPKGPIYKSLAEFELK